VTQLNIVDFIRARLDEVERVARAVEDRSAPWDGQWKNDSDHALRTQNGWVLAHNGGKPYAPGLLDHIALHDPASALRRVAADRRIVERCAEVIGNQDLSDYDRPGSLKDTATPLAVFLAVETLRDLALPYADHPDYREEFRP
jgi:hypothetical protein